MSSVGTDGEQPPRAGDSLQLTLASILEGEPRSRRQVAHGGGDDHLAGTAGRRYPRADVDREPAEVVASDLDLAGVHAGADLDPEGSDPVAGRERAPHRLGG
jgi:hypothetical protein